VVFGLQREFSLRVGRAARFTVALGPERSLKPRFIRRLFRACINKDGQVIAPDCTLDNVCRVQHPSTNFLTMKRNPPLKQSTCGHQIFYIHTHIHAYVHPAAFTASPLHTTVTSTSCRGGRASNLSSGDRNKEII
jgi:hypothetical protein